MRSEISYGKFNISLHRHHAAPLKVPAIPESEFTGRTNILFAVDIDVEVFGSNFLPAYTHGDNTMVVATDSMKNFVLSEAVAFTGSTLAQFLFFLGQRFLETYQQMESVRISGRELPFRVARVPGANGFEESQVLYAASHADASLAMMHLERDDTGAAQIVDHQCGRIGFELLKTTGSSFTQFVRDEHTTLPELRDRPLFMHMDIYWRYVDPHDALLESQGFVPAEQVADICKVVFHEFNSKSIQELVYKMAERILARFPNLFEVSFTAQNRTWDLAATHPDDPSKKVFWEPRAPYGNITLTLTRE
jgi:urate oxidase / 2-oxo-4-hydroxy-4-carboxy-5-ureidoimidazoline decarboxylase